MRAQAAESSIRSILFRFLLAMALARSTWLPINVYFRDVQFTATAFAGFLRDPELHFMLFLLAPFQQAALVVTILLLYGIQVEVRLDQGQYRLVGLVEPFVQKDRAYQRLQRVTGHTCFVTSPNVAFHNLADLDMFGQYVQLVAAHQFATHAR